LQLCSTFTLSNLRFYIFDNHYQIIW
jgi:hypothetical protein